jgi:O-antigen/teichoic acid export membrane protein
MDRGTENQGELSSSQLKEAALSGIRWTTAARVASEVVTFCSAVVMARLIPPSGFGQALVPTILLTLAVILTFEGYGSALVQRKTIEREHIEAALLASLLTGLVLCVVAAAIGATVAPTLIGAKSAELMIVMSPVFLFAGLGAVSRGLLWRKLDFRLVSVIEVVALTVTAAVGVGLAIAGLDAEAIVLAALVGAAVTSLLLVIAAPPPLPRWRPKELREVLSFGLPASGAGLTYVAITNSTLVIVAVRLSATQAGLFWRSFQLGVAYQEKISGIMLRLAFPVYSRTSDLAELLRFHERATRIHAAVLLPLLSILIVTAPELVPWVFGPNWAPAVASVQILAVAGMIAAVLTGYPQILLAAGKPRELLIFNLGLLALYFVASWLAAPHGITTLSYAVVGIHLILLVAVYAGLFRGVLGIPIRRLVTDIVPAVIGSAALLAVAFPVAGLLRDEGAPTFVVAAGSALSGGLVYLAILSTFFHPIWADLLALARRVVPFPQPRRRFALLRSR